MFSNADRSHWSTSAKGTHIQATKIQTSLDRHLQVHSGCGGLGHGHILNGNAVPGGDHAAVSERVLQRVRLEQRRLRLRRSRRRALWMLNMTV